MVPGVDHDDHLNRSTFLWIFAITVMGTARFTLCAQNGIVNKHGL